VILPCAKCGADVPEGARSCPSCGASLASIVLSKERRGLTKTLIGKAVELRQSIPWANPSQILLLEDPKRPGKKKVRSGARNAFVVMLLLTVGGGAFYEWRYPREVKQVDVYEVVVAPPETKPIEAPKPPVEEKTVAEPAAAEKPAPPESKPAVAEKPAPVPAPKPVVAEKPAEKPAPAPKPAAAAPQPPAGKPPPGTLVVVATTKGKPLKDASVHLNGVSLGNTPVKAAVVPGKYTVKIEHAGFKAEKRADVEVRPGKTLTVAVELKK
jgi:outer membrane biosynthesis protein TonB